MTSSGTPIEPELLYDYCSNTAGYEMLAQLIAVDPDTMEIDLIPRSRQELRSLVNESHRSIDRRLKEGSEKLEILLKETGEQYEQYDDKRRIYRIAPARIDRPVLREVKMRGYFRPRQPNDTVQHANIEGGQSSFGSRPEWEEFIREFLHD